MAMTPKTTVEMFESARGNFLIVRPPEAIQTVEEALRSNDYNVNPSRLIGDIEVEATHDQVRSALAGVALMGRYHDATRTRSA